MKDWSRVPLINRGNYHKVMQYLEYLYEDLGRSSKTIRVFRTRLTYYLYWLGSHPLSEAHNRKPKFPKYLQTPEAPIRKSTPLALTTQVHVCSAVRGFVTWLQESKPREYRGFTTAWIKGIRPRKRHQS